MPDSYRIGLEICTERRPRRLDGARFGLLMNQASVDRELRGACDLLARAFPGQLRALFSPQHGLWGEEQANMVETPHGRHPRLDLPVFSLYSGTRRPLPEMLEGLDCFVVDLQDVGVRVYTFAWTVAHCLEVCAAAGVPILVLDRPNPLGDAVEGPPLETGFESFVGLLPVPMRHGLTLGELALLTNCELDLGAEVDVLPMAGWRREDGFGDPSRRWIAPSPNLPRLDSVRLYPGQVLLEGTNLSEGRGTTAPFELVGAPFIEPFGLCDALEAFELPGVRFLPARFVPTFDKWQNASCGGVSLHVTDAAAFRPWRTTMAVLASVRRLWPEEFAWRPPPYEYETHRPPVDIIAGSAQVREAVDGGSCRTPADLDALDDWDREAWQKRTTAVRLYE